MSEEIGRTAIQCMAEDLVFHGRYGHETEEQAKARRVKRNQDASDMLLKLAARLAILEVKIAQAGVEPQAHPNGAPMFSTTEFKENGDPIMLDDKGNRSIFCDVDD